MKLRKIINSVIKKIKSTLKGSKNFSKNISGACAILELDYGHKISKDHKQSVDAQGNPLPWFTYPSIDYLKQLDLSNLTMLEWGSGNSSAFFSDRVYKIFSIENDQEWYSLVKGLELQNQEIKCAPVEYAKAPYVWSTKFDIILIDGIDRHECASEVKNLIKSGGIIILDNSDRYPDIAKSFRSSGYLQVDFHGFGPINEYTWTTTIFFDRSTKLNPIDDQPVIPIGGGY